MIGLRPRDRAKRRAQLRKLCIRFLPDNAAVLRDSLRGVPAVDKNIRYAGAKGAARDQLAAPVARKVERPHAVAPLCIIKAKAKGFSRIDEALLRQRIEVTNCHAPALDRFKLEAREAEHIIPHGQGDLLGGLVLPNPSAATHAERYVDLRTVRVEERVARIAILIQLVDPQRDGLTADLLGQRKELGAGAALQFLIHRDGIVKTGERQRADEPEILIFIASASVMHKKQGAVIAAVVQDIAARRFCRAVRRRQFLAAMAGKQHKGRLGKKILFLPGGPLDTLRRLDTPEQGAYLLHIFRVGDNAFGVITVKAVRLKGNGVGRIQRVDKLLPQRCRCRLLRFDKGPHGTQYGSEQEYGQGELSTHGKLLRLSLCKQYSMKQPETQVTKWKHFGYKM